MLNSGTASFHNLHCEVTNRQRIPKSWEEQSEESSEIPGNGLSTVNVLLTIKPHVSCTRVRCFSSLLCLNLVYRLLRFLLLREPAEPRGAFFGFVLSYYWSSSIWCLMCPKSHQYCASYSASRREQIVKSRLKLLEFFRVFCLFSLF